MGFLRSWFSLVYIVFYFYDDWIKRFQPNTKYISNCYAKHYQNILEYEGQILWSENQLYWNKQTKIIFNFQVWTSDKRPKMIFTNLHKCNFTYIKLDSKN